MADWMSCLSIWDDDYDLEKQSNHGKSRMKLQGPEALLHAPGPCYQFRRLSQTVIVQTNESAALIMLALHSIKPSKSIAHATGLVP